MINISKISISFAAKGVPETIIEDFCFFQQTDNRWIHTFNKPGFNIVATISDNNSTNVYAFNLLLKGHSQTTNKLKYY